MQKWKTSLLFLLNFISKKSPIFSFSQVLSMLILMAKLFLVLNQVPHPENIMYEIKPKRKRNKIFFF
jgi:lipid-A-disaccharide synthase-like uncharacterized protein